MSVPFAVFDVSFFMHVAVNIMMTMMKMIMMLTLGLQRWSGFFWWIAAYSIMSLTAT